MNMFNLICLIEDAEQGSSLQNIEDGKAARVELEAMHNRIEKLETALQALVNFDDKNYYQRVHITQEPDVMKQARAALETKP